MNWIRSLLSSNSSETDVNKELEQADTQPEKRQRIMDEQSMVVYGQQGFSSNSQLTSQLVTISVNSAVDERVAILTKNLKHLFARRHDILTELQNAEIQPGKKRREVVQNWLNDVQSLERKIQTILDGQGSSPNYNLSNSIESFFKETDELIQKGKFPNGLVLSDHKSTRYPLSLDRKPVGINFQQNTEEILGWLQDDVHWIIGVYGMGGVGKTTLLMNIHDQLLRDSEISGYVYWVTVSQNCPVHKLQDDIAKVLQLDRFEEDDEKKRAAILHKSITARGRIVLILDDMWEHVSGKVGIPLENINCKMILSTREYDVCRKMGCKDFVIKAEILQEGEAWDLFVEKLGHYDTLQEQAKKIAWDIAKECGGLPLAIATMARSMTDVVDINEWKTALNDLKSACDQADMKEDVYRILRHSYDRLKDERVQECFLSCILYGEDEEIWSTELIDFWLDEGLLDDIKSRDAQVSKGHTILNKLESSCLLESVLGYDEEDEEKFVKMHDLIRDMAIIITKERPLFIAEASKRLEQVPEEEKWSKDLVKVSLRHNFIKEIPSGMAPMTPNLTVLMLSWNRLKEISDSFFVHMKALTVLDLSRTGIERVPESVSDLVNLRSLRLAGCKKLVYVPSVAKLTRLRMLNLSRSCELKEAPRGLERLKSIEKISYIPWDVSDLIGFNKLIQFLNSLSVYKIFIRGVPVSYLRKEWEWFFDLYEKAVWIEGGDFGEDKSNCLLPTTLEYLRIDNCNIEGRSLEVVFPSVSKVTGMKRIVFINCRGLESISGTQYGSSSLFTTQLERIELVGLPDLISIAKLEAPHSFSHLRVLHITDCPKMKVVLLVTCTRWSFASQNWKELRWTNVKRWRKYLDQTGLLYPSLVFFCLN